MFLETTPLSVLLKSLYEKGPGGCLFSYLRFTCQGADRYFKSIITIWHLDLYLYLAEGRLVNLWQKWDFKLGMLILHFSLLTSVLHQVSVVEIDIRLFGKSTHFSLGSEQLLCQASWRLFLCSAIFYWKRKYQGVVCDKSQVDEILACSHAWNSCWNYSHSRNC